VLHSVAANIDNLTASTLTCSNLSIAGDITTTGTINAQTVTPSLIRLGGDYLLDYHSTTPDIALPIIDTAGKLMAYYDTDGWFNAYGAYFTNLNIDDLTVNHAINITGHFADFVDITAGNITAEQVSVAGDNIQISGEPDMWLPVYDDQGSIISFYDHNGIFNALAGDFQYLTATNITIADLQVDGNFNADTIDINRAIFTVAPSTMPDLLFPVSDADGNIVSAYSQDGTFNVIRMNASQVAINGALVSVDAAPSGAIDMQSYDAVGDALDNFCHVHIDSSTQNTLTAYNYMGAVSLVQTDEKNATLTVDDSIFQPSHTNKPLHLISDNYTLRAKVARYLNPTSVLLATSNVPPLDQATILCPCFIDDRINTTLVFDGMGQTQWWSDDFSIPLPNASQPNGDTALITTITGVPTPNQLQIGRNFPYTWDGLAHLIWGTNDSEAVARTGQIAISDNSRELYFSGNASSYLLAGLVPNSLDYQSYVPLPATDTDAALNGTIWTGDDVQVFSYDQGGRVLPKHVAPRTSESDKWATRSIFGRASFPRCSRLTTIVVQFQGGDPRSQQAFLEYFKQANPGKMIRSANTMPDVVVLYGEDTRPDVGALWATINAIRAVDHGDAFGPTDIVLHTGAGEFADGLLRSMAATVGLPCIDLAPLYDRTLYGFDEQCLRYHMLPDMSDTASATQPLAIPIRTRNFAFAMTLPGANDAAVWQDILGIDISLSGYHGNRLMFRYSQGNLWIGASTSGTMRNTICSIDAGTHALTVATTLYQNEAYEVRAGLPQLWVSDTIFDNSMPGQCLVALTGPDTDWRRSYILSVPDANNITTYDMPSTGGTFVGTLSIGNQFIPQDQNSAPHVTIRYDDSQIWCTQVASYIDNTQVILTGNAPQALNEQVVPLHIGRMSLPWTDTGYQLSTNATNALVVVVNRHTVRLGTLSGDDPIYFFDAPIERFGGEFYASVAPAVGSQEIMLSNLYLSQIKSFSPSATPWEMQGKSVMRTDVIDPFYANQDLSTY